MRVEAKKYSNYELWISDSAKSKLHFEGCEKEYVVLVIAPGKYEYYKRYRDDMFYKLRFEELAFMQLAGGEIPF